MPNESGDMKGPIYYLTRALHVLLGIGDTCRFNPTCSRYASEAIKKNGLLLGAVLGFWRILRCHPWGSYGIDPVPEIKVFRRKT